MSEKKLYDQITEMSNNLKIMDEYLERLPKNIDKDVSVVREYLKAAKQLAYKLEPDLGDEGTSKLSVEIYYMLRSQEKSRAAMEYQALMSEVYEKGLVGLNKGIVPPAPTDPDKGSGRGGFGIN